MTLNVDDATRRQISAAAPKASTWLLANAGSGKTRVLTDRVARLLLDQVPPQNILCLTYTKAAASEMQNRLFQRLGGWAMLDDETLRRELAGLGVDGRIDEDRLAAARRLFARAIETPGGLKIQTIHAFCASLLRQFPLEAGVSPQFTELDDRTSSILMEDVLEEISEGPDAGVMDGLARYLSADDALFTVARSVLKERDAFTPPLTFPKILSHYGLPDGFNGDALLAEVFDGNEADLVTSLLPLLAASGAMDQKAAVKLAPLRGGIASLADLLVLEGVLLTGAGAKQPFSAKIGSFPTKGVQKKLAPDVLDMLNDLMQRVEDARPARIAMASAERTAALHNFAGVFLPAVAARKANRGWLDFDDLILLARKLLSDPQVADWVLYKLDGGIDHILVDEAQDTSPVQWDVIQLLARELVSGDGARDDVARTVFVVGDRKQSIYSFQGADPAIFDYMQAWFDTQLAGSPTPLTHQVLEHSFRSSKAVLNVVDATFAGAMAQGIGGAPKHRAHWHNLPGRVDLWPLVEKAEKPEEKQWFEPLDTISPQHHDARLADAIADRIRELLDTGATLPMPNGQRKVLSAGDILILVRKRSTLFHEIIRACKACNIPLAGADRLTLTKDLAVRDLLALLRFLALPEDDLALATVLRSPLIGWDEDQLFRLANPRKGLLWSTLRTGSDPAHIAATEALTDLNRVADFLRPYDLLDRILTRAGGRQKLVARLGADREEAIDALLNAALSYEQSEIPSLTGFLEWMQAEDIEIKRQAESAGGRLRVMTVHGAKGLDSPVVILPDTGTRRASQADEVMVDQRGTALWRPRADETPPDIAGEKALLQEQQENERQRLLYVAMTRAEVWLIVCAAGEPDKSGTSWHTQVEAAMSACDAVALETPTGKGQRVAWGDWDAGTIHAKTVAKTHSVDMPDWLDARAPAAELPTKALSPSGLGGAKALPGDTGLDEDSAKRRGQILHLLLEHLPDFPPASWTRIAPRLLDSTDARSADFAGILDEATEVLTNPDLAFVFADDTLAEVDVTAHLPQLNARVNGVIDRLIIGDDYVLAVDFKSNAEVPSRAEDTPDGLVRQMAAYAGALSQIFPDKRIDTAILWTRRARLMPLPATLIKPALERVGAQVLDLDAKSADT